MVFTYSSFEPISVYTEAIHVAKINFLFHTSIDAMRTIKNVLKDAHDEVDDIITEMTRHKPNSLHWANNYELLRKAMTRVSELEYKYSQAREILFLTDTDIPITDPADRYLPEEWSNS